MVDIADPMAPYVLSAGNPETMEAVDVYKHRLIAVSGDRGISTFELPGAFVEQPSVDEGGYIADNETYQVTFNEFVTAEFLQQQGAVTVTRLDTGEPVSVDVEAVDPVEGTSNRFAIEFGESEIEPGVDFKRVPGVEY